MASKRGTGALGGPARNGLDAWIAVAGMVMSHPARVAILLALARDGSASPSDVAGAASVSLGACSYHMRTLVELGVVRLRATRPVRGAVEHFYELTGHGHAAVGAVQAVLALAPAASG